MGELCPALIRHENIITREALWTRNIFSFEYISSWKVRLLLLFIPTWWLKTYNFKMLDVKANQQNKRTMAKCCRVSPYEQPPQHALTIHPTPPLSGNHGNTSDISELLRDRGEVRRWCGGYRASQPVMLKWLVLSAANNTAHLPSPKPRPTTHPSVAILKFSTPPLCRNNSSKAWLAFSVQPAVFSTPQQKKK